jgi:hypothetical protein
MKTSSSTNVRPQDTSHEMIRPTPGQHGCSISPIALLDIGPHYSTAISTSTLIPQRNPDGCSSNSTTTG